jgi:hypothetical protein
MSRENSVGILGVDRMITLKLILKTEDVRVDLNHLAQDRAIVGLL